ncbi:MAG: GntR family transcriptional regulator [Gammaproteobacteria bacterium]|nr:GntR family transcriptional regulator [Gammaproteobacteria bacterium]
MNRRDDAGLPDFRPLYVQVEELLSRRLAQGDWRPGDLLPSESRLAVEFGVSQGTVRKALDRLVDRNALIRRQGKGTFVASYTPDRALFHFFHLVPDSGEHRLPASRVLEVARGQARAHEQTLLGLDSDELVVRIERLRCFDTRPVLVERISVADRLFPGLGDMLPARMPNTLYSLYETAYGVSIARAEERLKARSLSTEDAALLGLDPGAPVLEIERLARGRDDRVVELRVSLCDTGAYHYRSLLQ